MGVLGKKHIVIPEETYNMLMSQHKNTSSYQPERKAMLKSEQEMKNVWDRIDLPDDEKVNVYTREMNNSKNHYNTLSKPKPIEFVVKVPPESNIDVQSRETQKKPEDDKKHDITDNIGLMQDYDDGSTRSLPRNIKTVGKLLENFMKTHTETITWNSNGGFIYNGKTLHGTNMKDLLLDVLSNRQKALSPLFFITTSSG